MAYEQRAPLDYLSGTLSTAAAISDTALVADAFANLPADYSTTKYAPLVLHDPSAGLYEVVWVTAHTATSTTVTAVRGREGSAARAWPSGTHFVCAPTARDVVSASTLAGLPSDPHLGQRLVVTDKGYITERATGVWAPSVGVALADQVGPNRVAANPSSSAPILMRAGYASLTTNGSGQVTVTYRTAFPTATLAAFCIPAGGGVTFYSISSETANGFTATAWIVSSLSPYTTVPFTPGHNSILFYLAVGY